MEKSYIICFLALVLVSCQSGQTTKSSLSDSSVSKAAQNAIPADFKFSLFISGDGTKDGMADSWTLDTNGMMTVNASVLASPGKYKSLRGMAGLDQRDMDTLRMLIWKGKLLSLDSADLTQQCGGDELIRLRIVPLSVAPPVTLSFDACASDFNLLTGQQRIYFRKFMDWWGRMRAKYRPVQQG
jgi:hypothetical protein